MLTTLALNAYLTGLLVVLFLFICVVMILTVLIQRPAGGGLSGAFGSGAGSGQTAFGAKTGDALTIATIVMFAIYLLAAVGLNYAARPVDPGAATTATGTSTDGLPAAPSGQAPAPATPEDEATDGAATPAEPAPDDGATEPPAPTEQPAEQPSASPAEPAPQPASGDESEPAPSEPAPSEPAPSEPAPSEPAPPADDDEPR